jgi:predicted MFS family arabinose efflux permease
MGFLVLTPHRMMPQNVSDGWKPSTRTGLVVAAGLALSVAVSNGFSRFVYALILPAMRNDLGWSYTEAGWNNTANAIGYLLGAMLAFRLTRRFTTHGLFATSLWITTAALVLTGFTSDFLVLSLFRFVAGVSGAVVFVAGGILVANVFPHDAARSATAIAVYFAGGGAAIVLTGITLPWLFAHAGDAVWPYAWIAIGMASLGASVVAVVAARRVKVPKVMVNDGRWVKWPFAPLLVAYGLFGIGYIAYMTFIIAWLREHGAGAVLISSFWAVLGIATMLAPSVWRQPLAEWPGGRPLAVVLIVLAIGAALPLWQTTPTVMITSAVVYGGTFYIAPTAVTAFARKALPPQQWGEAIAGFTILFALCQCLGPVLSGAISDAAGSLFAGLGFSALALIAGAAVALLQHDIKM